MISACGFSHAPQLQLSTTCGTVANLRRMDVSLREIRYVLATHYHIDHAGLAEELKSECNEQLWSHTYSE